MIRDCWILSSQLLLTVLHNGPKEFNYFFKVWLVTLNSTSEVPVLFWPLVIDNHQSLAHCPHRLLELTIQHSNPLLLV